MKTLIASVVAFGVIATPAVAQTNSMSSSTGAKSTKTMVTNGPKSTATTNARSGERGESAAQEAKERHHARRHHKKHHRHSKKAMTAKVALSDDAGELLMANLRERLANDEPKALEGNS